MKWLSQPFNFYLDASIHVALSILALVLGTYLLLDTPIDPDLSLFLFFGSISCYNFVKYGVEAEKYLKLTNQYHKSIQYFSVACLLPAAYFAFSLHRETWIGIAVLVILTGLYAIPILPKSKNLRSWGGIKIFLVAAVWAGATVILPILEASKMLRLDIWIETIQRMLMVLVLLIPFEIRDLKYDAPSLKTFPQRFGVSNTRTFGLFLVAVFFLLTFFKDTLSPMEIKGKGLLTAMLIGTLLITKRNQSKYFASFWVESIPILWVVLLVFLKKMN